MTNVRLRASRSKLIPGAVVVALFLVLFLNAPIVPVAAGCVFAVVLLTLPHRQHRDDPQ